MKISGRERNLRKCFQVIFIKAFIFTDAGWTSGLIDQRYGCLLADRIHRLSSFWSVFLMNFWKWSQLDFLQVTKQKFTQFSAFSQIITGSIAISCSIKISQVPHFPRWLLRKFGWTWIVVCRFSSSQAAFQSSVHSCVFESRVRRRALAY